MPACTPRTVWITLAAATCRNRLPLNRRRYRYPPARLLSRSFLLRDFAWQQSFFRSFEPGQDIAWQPPEMWRFATPPRRHCRRDVHPLASPEGPPGGACWPASEATADRGSLE